MSAYLSNLLTNTTSRYNSLRRTLLSDEADGDTEDDSHISRVLRAYYTEKGQAFPPWLPPDPKRAPLQSTPSYGSSFRQPTQAQAATSAPQRGALSDLWDPPAQQTAAPSQPTSLRRQAQARSAVQGRSQDTTLQPPQARPLPSQRAGSYQSQMSQRSPSEPSPPLSSSGGGGGTAQERLKARLWGAARAASPTASYTSTGGSSNASVDPGYDSGSGNPYANQQPYDGGQEGGYGGRYGREKVGTPNGPRPR